MMLMIDQTLNGKLGKKSWRRSRDVLAFCTLFFPTDLQTITLLQVRAATILLHLHSAITPLCVHASKTIQRFALAI
jgi:hypothetical protein